MGKRKKAAPPWMMPLRGSALALGIYLLGAMLLAWCVVRGAVGEGSAPAVLMVLAGAAVFLGAMSAVRRCPWGVLPAALTVAATFALVLAVVGLAAWGGISWSGIVLLLCALAGAVLAAVCGRKRRTKRRF